MVLAGGRSSRFGSDKLTAPYRGRPLLRWSVERLAEVCGEVVVVLGPGTDEPSSVAGLPVRFARDEIASEGPLAGTVAGLAAVGTELALVAGGDMPGLVDAVLREMLRVAEEAPVEAVALQDGDRSRPMPCVVRTRTALTNGQTLFDRGERSLRSLLDSLRVAVIDEATWCALDPARFTLEDVDSPGDLDHR